MTLKSDPKYPVRRAYVIKMREDATPQTLCGRLEYLISGEHKDFLAANELCELIAADIETDIIEIPVKSGPGPS